MNIFNKKLFLKKFSTYNNLFFLCCIIKKLVTHTSLVHSSHTMCAWSVNFNHNPKEVFMSQINLTLIIVVMLLDKILTLIDVSSNLNFIINL